MFNEMTKDRFKGEKIMGRNIRVTGKGKFSLKPDTICLAIEAEGVYPDYETTIKESADRTIALRKSLEKSGLSGKELKTKHFSIQSEYESYRDKNDDYKRRFVGYKFEHHTEIKFPNDNKQLGRTLYELSHCPVEVEFTIYYTVSNPGYVKNELLKKAVEDSKKKAEILAEAAGVKLGEIEHIDYSWGELQILSHPIDKLMAQPMLLESEASYDIDIEADDIDVNDTVTIEWSIR